MALSPAARTGEASAENYFEVCKALKEARPTDPIAGCDALIPAHPPREALQARQERANKAVRGGHYRGQSIQGREARRAWAAKPGLPAGAEDCAPTGQEAQAEGRQFRPAPIACL
jgi:hypothetical protein